MYIPFNDYELLYLYKDGNERAFNLLFRKYEHLIQIVVNDYMPYNDKKSDMVQEGRIVLYRCINSYSESIGTSFYTYFIISLKRRLHKLAKDDYYQEYCKLNESIDYHSDCVYSEGNTLTKLIINSTNKDYSSDFLALDIFNECILGNMKIMDFCRKYNVSYNSTYYKYKQIIDNIKRSFK